MSRITCLIMISECSALSISSFKFARIKVETLSSNAITPPNRFCCFHLLTKFPASTLPRWRRLRRVPAEPITTPRARPMPSQKSQPPAIKPATIPSIAPRTTPTIEIFFFIAFSVIRAFLSVLPASWLRYQPAGLHLRLRMILSRSVLLRCRPGFAGRRLVPTRKFRRGLRRLVANLLYLGEQLRHAHAGKRFNQRRHLCRDRRHISGN